MTSAEFDTRRRLLGLSIQEAADYLGVQRRTVERWIRGYSEVNPDAVERLLALEGRMSSAVEQAVAAILSVAGGAPKTLLRYRSQAAVDASPHAAGMPLGAHAILIGWIADELNFKGADVEIAWGDTQVSD